MKYTNEQGIPLGLAVMLAYDDYPTRNDPKVISATTLLKSPRQIILGMRAKISEDNSPEDISTRVASVVGQAIHSRMEYVWRHHYKECLASLGYPNSLIDMIRIDPTDEECSEDIVPVYLETRSELKVGDWTVTGAFDLCINGDLADLKNTSTYTYEKSTKTDDYIMQGSIYKWLNSEKIKSDFIEILFHFGDWKALNINKPNYPSHKMLGKRYKLMTIPETGRFIASKLALISSLEDVYEKDLPYCTDKELWVSEGTLWKYFKDPSKTSRSTKNFTNIVEANARLVKDGSVGIVKEVKPKARACSYCNARANCTQYINLAAEGRA